MKIKKVTSRDVAAIFALGKIQFDGEYWFTRRFIADTLQTEGKFLGAYVGRQLVGVIFLRLYDPPKSWIYFFVVDPQFRRMGVGTALLTGAESLLDQRYFITAVDFENSDKEAIKFYKKNGFKREAAIRDWFGPGSLGLIYIKRRSSP